MVHAAAGALCVAAGRLRHSDDERLTGRVDSAISTTGRRLRAHERLSRQCARRQSRPVAVVLACDVGRRCSQLQRIQRGFCQYVLCLRRIQADAVSPDRQGDRHATAADGRRRCRVQGDAGPDPERAIALAGGGRRPRRTGGYRGGEDRRRRRGAGCERSAGRRLSGARRHQPVELRRRQSPAWRHPQWRYARPARGCDRR